MVIEGSRSHSLSLSPLSFSFLYSMFEAYKYANVWNVQERVIALHTFMHSVLFKSVCEAKSYEEEKEEKKSDSRQNESPVSA